MCTVDNVTQMFSVLWIRNTNLSGIDSVLFYNGESHILSSLSLPVG